MLFFIFYFPLLSHASRAGGRIQAESTFYIYAEVQHISSIHYSLWAAFPCSFVMCFLRQGCSRRTDCLPYFPLPFSFFSFLFAHHRGLRNTCTYVCIFAAKVECPSFIELWSYINSCAIAGNSSSNFTVRRNIVALWKCFLAFQTTSSLLSWWSPRKHSTKRKDKRNDWLSFFPIVTWLSRKCVWIIHIRRAFSRRRDIFISTRTFAEYLANLVKARWWRRNCYADLCLLRQ